jgi:hypothetical protein
VAIYDHSDGSAKGPKNLMKFLVPESGFQCRVVTPAEVLDPALLPEAGDHVLEPLDVGAGTCFGELALGVPPLGEDDVDLAGRLADRPRGGSRIAGRDLRLGLLGQPALADRATHDPERERLDRFGERNEAWVVRLEGSLLDLQVVKGREVMQQRVGGRSKLPGGLGHRLPSAPTWRGHDTAPVPDGALEVCRRWRPSRCGRRRFRATDRGRPCSARRSRPPRGPRASSRRLPRGPRSGDLRAAAG